MSAVRGLETITTLVSWSVAVLPTSLMPRAFSALLPRKATPATAWELSSRSNCLSLHLSRRVRFMIFKFFTMIRVTCFWQLCLSHRYGFLVVSSTGHVKSQQRGITQWRTQNSKDIKKEKKCGKDLLEVNCDGSTLRLWSFKDVQEPGIWNLLNPFLLSVLAFLRKKKMLPATYPLIYHLLLIITRVNVRTTDKWGSHFETQQQNTSTEPIST